MHEVDPHLYFAHQKAQLSFRRESCGSVTALRADDSGADLQVFPSGVIPWFRMSTSIKPVSLNEDVGAYILCLKTTRGMFEALSATESNDHSHSWFKEDKGL